ncbi:MAG: hypothetical protein ACXVAY_18680 [Mucilaginibacter sp.]
MSFRMSSGAGNGWREVEIYTQAIPTMQSSHGLCIDLSPSADGSR